MRASAVYGGRSSTPRAGAVSSGATGGTSSTAPASASAGTTPSRQRSGPLSSYVLGSTLGQGTFGKVKIATHVLTNEQVAVKILEKDKIREASAAACRSAVGRPDTARCSPLPLQIADVKRVSREIKILKRVRHDNVIQLFEVIDAPKQVRTGRASATCVGCVQALPAARDAFRRSSWSWN